MVGEGDPDLPGILVVMKFLLNIIFIRNTGEVVCTEVVIILWHVYDIVTVLCMKTVYFDWPQCMTLFCYSD